MADYTNSKGAIGAAYPVNAVEDVYGHLEPLITPEQIKNRHLIGVSMVSPNKDPLTGKPTIITNEMIEELIRSAVSIAEQELKIDIMPVRRKEKHPFDRNLYASYMYFQTQHKPVTSIDKMTVTPSNNTDIYTIPAEWIEAANFPRGQVNVVPLTVAYVQGTYISPDQTGGGAAFMTIMGSSGWVPAFWQLEYTSGFKDGMVPRLVNDYIGLTASAELLSQMATMYARVQSFSQGIDGMSQSVSTPGPQLFRTRLDEIEKKLQSIRNKVRNQYGHKIFSGTL